MYIYICLYSEYLSCWKKGEKVYNKNKGNNIKKKQTKKLKKDKKKTTCKVHNVHHSTQK